MAVHVRDLKGDGKAWLVIYDKRLPKGYLRRCVGSDWKAAQRAASAIREKLTAGDLTFMRGGSSAQPLQAAVEQYLDERLAFRTMDPDTRDNYLRMLRLHAWPTLGQRPVDSIRRDDLKALFEGLLAAGKSKSLCRNLLAPIKQTYEWLIDDRHLPLASPAVRLGRYVSDVGDKKKRVKPLSPEEQAAFLAAARAHHPRHYFLFLLAMRAGLRLSECLGLRWTDFNLARRVVTVERQLREGRLVDHTKKHKVRDVDLSREVCAAFSEHRDHIAAWATRVRRAIPEYVFTSGTGSPLHSPSSLARRVMRPVASAAGLGRHVSFQHFRQTFVTDVVASAGERGLLYASQQAGHASIKVTADYYARAMSRDRSIVDALDQRVADATGAPHRLHTPATPGPTEPR